MINNCNYSASVNVGGVSNLIKTATGKIGIGNPSYTETVTITHYKIFASSAVRKNGLKKVGVMSEQVYYMWSCSKCGQTQGEEVPFCTRCAANEGAPNAETAPADKVGKITEAMMGAINWSLSHATLKPDEVLAHATKRGLSASAVADLKSKPLASLDQLAGSFTNLNRMSATGTGFAAGLPGGLVGFVAIPADVSAVIYFSLRCMSGISQSYSFESDSEAGKAILLLAFAHACRMETFIIGTRRLENLPIARFLLQNPEPYSQLVRTCLIKQLANYLAVDFAKTSWATFLPVVGGIVNGTNNFLFIGDISSRGKIFYRSLLYSFQSGKSAEIPPETIEPEPKVIEIRDISLPLSVGKLKAQFVYPEQASSRPLILLLWEGQTSPDLAEQLAEKGFPALIISGQEAMVSSPQHLQEVLEYVQKNVSEFAPEMNQKLPGVIAGGKEATLVLDLLAQAPASFSVVVVYNPAGESREVITDVPLLLHWSEKAEKLDKLWPERLRPLTHKARISVVGYSVGQNFFDPNSPDYNRQVERQAWAETLEWLDKS